MTDHITLTADIRTTLTDTDRCHRLNIQSAWYVLERALRTALNAVEDLVAENETLREGRLRERRALVHRINDYRAQHDVLQAQLDRIREARSDHPACDRHPDGELISCGWKTVVLDIDAALTGDGGK